MDCVIKVGENKKLHVEAYWKPTNTDQYLMFDSHHPLKQKLGVIRTLQHQAEGIPIKGKGMFFLQKACGYPVSKHDIPVYFKPMSTLRKHLDHPKNRIGLCLCVQQSSMRG